MNSSNSFQCANNHVARAQRVVFSMIPFSLTNAIRRMALFSKSCSSKAFFECSRIFSSTFELAEFENVFLSHSQRSHALYMHSPNALKMHYVHDERFSNAHEMNSTNSFWKSNSNSLSFQLSLFLGHWQWPSTVLKLATRIFRPVPLPPLMKSEDCQSWHRDQKK